MIDKVSVVVPIYNAEEFLFKCLDSTINQTFKNLEIILIDDGSKDSSSEICKKYQKKDSRIIYIKNSNNGVSYSRNYGIKIATGKYIVFVDSDDYLSLSFIENMVLEDEKNDYDLIISGYKDVYPNNILKKNMVLDYNLLTTYLANDYYKLLKFLKTPWGKLYKLDIIKKNKIFFPQKFITSEDQIFNFNYFKHVKKYKFINYCGYFYVHQNKNSLSKLATYKAFEDNLKRLKIEKEFLVKANIKDKNKILSDDAAEIIKGYIFLSGESIIDYNKYKKRMYMIRKILDDQYSFTSKKNYILLNLLKYKCFFLIYLYKILKNI